MVALMQAQVSEAGARMQLYPDIGVASMLRNQWGPGVAFQIAAVNDRQPVAEDDELVVLAAPDPQSPPHAARSRVCAGPGRRGYAAVVAPSPPGGQLHAASGVHFDLQHASSACARCFAWRQLHAASGVRHDLHMRVQPAVTVEFG